MQIDKLKGMAVVSLGEGAVLGRVEAPLFDRDTLQLRAIRVAGEGQTFIVPWERVRTVGADAVMVESSQATQAAAKGGEFGDLAELGDLRRLQVVDAAGTLVGTLHDLELDPTTGAARRIVAHKGGVLGFGGETATYEAAAIRQVGRGLITVATAGAPPPGQSA